ncbi:thiol-disulfide oxidoreductase DCC family protein [Paenibacillus sp. KN14-4R]|uniref:thiol-disulfide oxidoreductase DCC family protein n=1 Tax=Paenibacillus sp. KN14-4R TaxID=3445773 RepID=UPI003FA17891
MTRKPMNDPVIVLFDGVCNMCNGIVQFTIRHDPKKQLQFASLQSNAGQRLLEAYSLSTSDLNTFVLIDNNRAYTKSTAALRLIRKLNKLWPLLYVGIVVPRPLRDSIYSYIAHHRYKWFGQAEACMVPTPDMKQRFLSE